MNSEYRLAFDRPGRGIRRDRGLRTQDEGERICASRHGNSLGDVVLALRDGEGWRRDSQAERPLREPLLSIGDEAET
jgi:hypothetical protein